MAWIELQAADGHRLHAWQATPTTPPRGGIVVLQEIFGVNAHVRSLCERHAAQGWLTVAPSLFDRAVAEVPEMGYGADDIAQGLALKGRIDEGDALLDVQATIDHLQARGLKVAGIGFCWGGTLAWLAATRLQGVQAVIAYYGTHIAGHLDEAPRVPVMLHFGATDSHIPPEHVERIAAACPQAALHVYPAGHGFSCDARAAFHLPSAELAGARSAQFLKDELSC